jgi:hypothetical protein
MVTVRNERATLGVLLHPSQITLEEGSETQLIATVLPHNASVRTVTWRSSNADVATVDAAGNVTAVTSGIAVITVTTDEGAETAASAVTVIEKTEETITGADILEAPLTLKPYPNPTNGLITLNLDELSSNCLITIVDLSGKIILRKTATGGQTVELDISAYPAGIYLLTVENGRRKKTARVVKN